MAELDRYFRLPKREQERVAQAISIGLRFGVPAEEMLETLLTTRSSGGTRREPEERDVLDSSMHMG